MPAPEYSHRLQTALLFAQTNRFNAYGEPLVDDPVEIQVRWDWVYNETLDPKTNNISLDAKVVVGQYVPLGSLMWLGTLSEWYGGSGTGSGSASTQEQGNQLMEVKTVTVDPDLKARNVYTTVGLMRYRNVLPTAS
jgi:hypothetical protein